MRVYHSVSLLLPDGTVLHGSSGDAMAEGAPVLPRSGTTRSSRPPISSRGRGPAISSAPSSVGYGQDVLVVTPNTAQITQVRWIRLGSVTHAFDASARANTVEFPD